MAFNGMRRLLGGAAPPAPIAMSTPPTEPTPETNSTVDSTVLSSPTSPASPGITTKAAFFRKNSGPSSRSSSRDLSFVPTTESSPNRQPPQRKASTLSISSSPPFSNQSLPRPNLPSLAKAINTTDLSHRSPPLSQPLTSSSVTWKNASSMLNVKDELIIGLLASQAMVDSRDSEILSSEEVDELKQEHALLSSRVISLSKKVALETKIRDAALTLRNLGQPPNNVPNQANDQLQAANKKVDAAQQELLKITARANDILQQLLEHRAGVLSFVMRGLEKKVAGLTGHPSAGTVADTDDSESGLSGDMSPASTTATSLSVAPKKFDGAHFFAGHSDALTPAPQSPYTTAAVKEMEEKLKLANEALRTSQRKQEDMARDISMLELERSEVETKMALELQAAEEKIASLRDYLDEAQERAQNDLEELEELRQSNEKLAIAEESLETLKKDLVKKEYDVERLLEEKKSLQGGMENLRQSMESSQNETNQEAINVKESLRAMCLANRISVPSAGFDLSQLLVAVENHLKGVDDRFEQQVQQREQWDETRRELEKEIRGGMESRERLNRELEDARREREEARKDIRSLETQVKEKSDLISELESRQIVVEPLPTLPPTGLAGNELYDQLVGVLKPLWSILPSVEARAAKAGSLRSLTPRSPNLRSPDMSPSLSLSDLDVRALKSLYDPKGGFTSPGLKGEFHPGEFVARVQALIVDDRALVERLIRFAQAHELLKSNAERAQKLAQESVMGLETYQKQVKTLEERNGGLTSKQSALMDEIEDLQSALERAEVQLREVQAKAAEQAETCRSLTEANNTLSATTLSLAEQAAATPEKIRQMEDRITELSKKLKEANDDLDAIRAAESMQRVALLDELNTMQQENGNLRNQLRARGGK